MRMKKLISLLLAALMVVCLLPTAAFAEEVTYNSGDEGGVQMSLTVEGTVQYTVNVNASPAQYGTVTGGGKYDEGTSVTVTATPNDGYIFTGWRDRGKVVENAGASYTFTATADRVLTAVFVRDDGPEFTLQIEDDGYFEPIETKDYYSPGEMVTVTAIPKHGGIKFNGWWERNYDGENPNPGRTLVCSDVSYSFNIEKDTCLVIDFTVTQDACFFAGEGVGYSFTVGSQDPNKEQYGYVIYTSDGPDDLKLYFPSADCFTAPEGKVFDCWEVDGVGYEAGSVQTVIGSGANPAFSGKKIYITAKWKDDDSGSETDLPSCVLSIPAKINIPYMQEKTLVNWKLESLNLAGRETLDLTFFAGTFSNSKGQTIAYKVAGDENADIDSRALYIFKSAGGRYVTVVDIAKAEWEAAAPGEYTATLRFNVYFH